MIKKRWMHMFNRVSSAVALVTAALSFAVILPATAEEDAIPIGFIGTLTGFNAVLGEDTLRGVEIAIDEVNAAGGVHGRKLKLIKEDDENDAQKAVTAARKLIDLDDVWAIIGPPHSAYALATSAITRRAQVVQISPISTMDRLTDPVNPYFFRTWVRDRDVATVIASLAAEYGRIGILYETTPWGDGGKDRIVSALRKINKEPVDTEAFDISTQDLTPQILNFKKADVDAVIVQAQGADAAQALRAMKQLAYKPAVIGHPGLTMESFPKLARDDADGTIVLDGIDSTKSSVVKFNAAYQARQGEQPFNFFPAAGYDSVMIIVQALNRSGADRMKLRDAVESTTGYEGVNGKSGATISYGPDDHDGLGAGDMVLKVFLGGKMVPAKN
ncbi:ABC transporter substrate-binding protein [Oceanibacterium hippocampi]|uniref:Leu/Ile/Val-binding protein n=1 Tax=Oceanibacterium hippocampi TaxID=745714 RepID=A0A1Y5TZ10_9PROT|nr:ABC transporter substrate-binding protein [Oceanibacterium hippocampi]SLN74050.1 Leu/Ile/Val-binding protein precursor [Oceanibacterium hippocampi]